MISLPPEPQRECGSARVALLCAIGGAAAVFAWSALTPRDASRATPPQAVAATGESQQLPSPAPRIGLPQAPPTPSSTVTGLAESAGDAAVTSPESSASDADGFSPDYAVLIDEFEQQRALEPLVDD
jgi:hypothetical protein